MSVKLPRRLATLLFGAAVASTPLGAATFTVTNISDSGTGSLRQAILDANANFGDDVIEFNIPGNGVHTISIFPGLPAITQPVIIDGYSQPGASANTNPVGQGLNTILKIEITGNVAGVDPCLTVNAGNSNFLAMIIQGLIIDACGGPGILVSTGGDGTWIIGNFIGTDATGSSSQGGQLEGVHIQGETGAVLGVVIGGSTPFARNLISGNNGDDVFAGGADGTVITGNLIGTNAAGTAAIPPPSPNFQNGVHVYASANVRIGGPTLADRNVISGHEFEGVYLESVGSSNTVQGNYIGTDVTGMQPVGNFEGMFVFGLSGGVLIKGNVIGGNQRRGIVSPSAGSIIQGNFIGTDESGMLDLGSAVDVGILFPENGCTIGGTAPGEGNVIAHYLFGVVIASPDSGIRIRGNRIFDNAFLGIDLSATGSADGVTPNDPGDVDAGANRLQNTPMITSVVPAVSTTHIAGLLNSTASTTFDVDLFSNAPCLRRPQDYLQGETYLGSVQVTTDGAGNATFATDVPFVLDQGELVTATATDPDGNTSEFSQRIVFSTNPSSGPAEGGTTALLSGMLFEPGATVSVGGVPATNIDVQSQFAIAATMPPLSAGSVNDITVLDPSGVTGTLRNGWVADFLDVPSSNQFYTFVNRLAAQGVSAGIGGGLYGVGNGVLRSQMAVFLLKGKHGVCYTPPPCTGVFADVTCPSPFADWIEALAAEGITGGCGGGSYCPGNPVRRDQMAVFLLKAEHGSTFVPPACTSMFSDVTCPSLFADWIERLASEQITSGCGGGNYCPFSNNTRGQMAVFIVKTFGLQ